MGYLSKYGTLWADIPQTQGRMIWVSPISPYTVDGRAYSSSDNNDGLSPERALATITQAITNATANVGDVICLMQGAGTAHTSAAQVAINKAGLTFVGIHPYTRTAPTFRNTPITYSSGKVQWVSTFAGAGIAITVADTTFIGIDFGTRSAQTAITANASASFTQFVDCCIEMSGAASVSTKGVVFTGAADRVSFTNCLFQNIIGAQGPALDLTGVTHFLIQHSTFFVDTGTWAIAVQLGAGSQGIVRDNEFYAGAVGVMTTGIDGTGVVTAKSVQLVRNMVGVSPGTGFGANFGLANARTELVNNYLATVSGGTGSTLITTTT